MPSLLSLIFLLAAATAPAHASRIVSLMPSLTQDLCAVGADKQIVAVSQFSSDIPCAKGLPRVANFSSVDTEAIVRLHPDLVVAIPSQRLLLAPLRAAGIPVVLLADDTYGSIFTDIERLGELAGRSTQAHAEVEKLRSQTRRLQASEHFRRRPSVFVVLQAQPIWTVGPQSYISRLLNLAGARNAVRALPLAYAEYNAESLLRAQPDAIIAGSATQLQSLLAREPWRSLRAVQQHHVFIYNSSMLDRPGPNYPQALSWLIKQLRPLAQ